MEENTFELFDYFSVIRKRKILIIVVTLVCIVIGVGVGVMNSMSKLTPVTYVSDAVVRIGKKVTMSFNSASLVPIEIAGDLVVRIPITYKGKVNEIAGYQLDVKQIGRLPMIELTMKGPDSRVEATLEEIIDELIDEHHKYMKSSAYSYETFIKKLEKDALMIHENIATINESIIKMRTKEKTFLGHMEASEGKVEKEKELGDLSVIWNMLYLKTIDKEIDLSTSRQSLRNIQWQLLVHRTTMDNLEDYNTKMIGKIIKTAIAKESNGSTTKTMSVAVVAGLIMSLFIAFLTEYVMESRSRRKGK
tara:strand:+ start:202 stop:1116 length:915 start_codon:yes stop_codon:yes gene_type:complete